MKRYINIAIILLLLLPQVALATAGLADVSEEDPGLFLFMVFILLGFIGVVAIGIIACAILAGIILLLAGTGVFSIALLVAWYHRSIKKGVRTFLRLGFMIFGSLCALLLLFILVVFNVQWVSNPMFCIAITVAGAAAVWVCSRIIERSAKIFFDRLHRTA